MRTTIFIALVVALVVVVLVAANVFAAQRHTPIDEATALKEFASPPRRGDVPLPKHLNKKTKQKVAEETFEFLPHQEAASLSSTSSSSSSSNNETTQDKQTVGDAGDDLVNVFFMHRHGARTSATVHDGVPDWNMCVLSPQGEEMAKTLGRFLRRRYKTDMNWTLFPPSYDPFKINSLTTDFERTIRTGTALLQAMFDDDLDPKYRSKLAVAPYLNHKPQNLDFMLSYYYSWPSAQLHAGEILGWYPNNNGFVQTLLTAENFSKIGAFLDAATLCNASGDTQASCAVAAEDFVTCDESNFAPGRVPSDVAALLPTLEHIYATSLKFIYLSDPASDYWRGVGFYAAEVVRDMMRKGRAALASKNLSAPGEPVMHHYSAHDITVFGLMVALGVLTNTTTERILLVPPFTTLALFELFRNKTMRFRYATCDQAFNSSHDFAFAATSKSSKLFKMACMPPGGSRVADMYHSEACPMDDVERALNFTTDTFYPMASHVLEETMCYADPADVRSTGCDVFADDTAAAHQRSLENAHCQYYRRYCPEVACSKRWLNREIFPSGSAAAAAAAAEGRLPPLAQGEAAEGNVPSSQKYEYVYNETSYLQFQCVPIRPQTIARDVLRTAASKAGVFIASLLLGVVLGAAIGAFFVRRGAPHHRDADESRNLLAGADANPAARASYAAPEV